MKPLMRGFVVSAVSSIFVFVGLSVFLLGEPRAGYAAVVGIIAMMALLYITKYYTGPGEKPVVDIARASKTGAGTNLISGLSLGMESTFYFRISCRRYYLCRLYAPRFLRHFIGWYGNAGNNRYYSFIGYFRSNFR